MIKELMQLGLTENESKVYLSLLELGRTTAGEIIKKTRLHRNIVYENLEKLCEKGFVNYILIKNIKNFQASNLSELREYINLEKQKVLEKENLLKEIIPKIEKLKDTKIKQEASIIQGKKALKEILEYMTGSKTEILVFGTGWGMRTIFEDYYEQWHLKLKNRKIACRIVLPISNKGKFLEPFKARYLKEKDLIPSTIAIYEDKILNIVWEREPLAYLIINKTLSESYKKYFDYLWGVAKK